MRRLYFTDNTYIDIAGDEIDGLSQYENYVYENVLVIANNNSPLKYKWNGIKTDLDGNTWSINNGQIEIYIKGVGIVYKETIPWNRYSGVLIIYNPENSTEGFYISNYNNTYIFTDGINSSSINFSQYISSNPNNLALNIFTNVYKTLYYTGQHTYLSGFGGSLLRFEWFSNSIRYISDIKIITHISITPAAIPIAGKTLKPVEVASGTADQDSIDLSVFNQQWYEQPPTGGEYVEITERGIKDYYKYRLETVLAIPEESQDAYDFADTGTGSVSLNGVSCVVDENVQFVSWIKSEEQDALTINVYSLTVEPSKDPYDEGGTSETGGGDGNFDDTSDSNTFPPKINVAYIGSTFGSMATIYAPSVSQFTEFTNYMWGNTIWSVIQGLVGENGIDILTQRILSHHLLPLNVNTSGTKEVKIGWIPTDVSMTVAADEYEWLDCGSITISEYWKGYMDYNPYTRIQLYLPYVGYVDLNTDEVMSNAIHVKYQISLATGAFNCMVEISGGGKSYIGYSYAGNCAMKLPITGNDPTYLRDSIGLVGSIGAGALGAATGGIGAVTSGIGASIADSVNGQKEYPKSTGTISMNSGFLGNQNPFLIIQRPRQLVPERQHKYTGYPSFVTMTLGNVSGWTTVEDINLTNMSCTAEERDEIMKLLKTGVII